MSSPADPARPWAAEVEISAETAERLIAAQMPDLAPARVEPFGIGWDNTAFLVNGEWIFRFPRRKIAVPLLEAETRLLPALAGRLPLPIPNPVWRGRPAMGYPWPFAGYRRLEGTTACRAHLDEDQRAQAAEPLALFLRALHDVHVGELDVGPDTWGRLDVPKRVRRVRERLEQLVAAGHLPPDELPALLAVAGAAPTDWTPGETTLVHGDLYSRHLLVDGEGRPCGVIDWGDVHRGDPAVDLAMAYVFLPPPARRRFFDIYGEVDEERHAVARLRALFSAVAILVYGHDVGDADLVREGEVALGFLRSLEKRHSRS